jgi:hypothetical protein
MTQLESKEAERLNYFAGLLEQTFIPLLENYIQNRNSSQVYYFVVTFLESHSELAELLNRVPLSVIQACAQSSDAFYYYLVLLEKVIEEKESFDRGRLFLNKEHFFQKEADRDVNFTKLS